MFFAIEFLQQLTYTDKIEVTEEKVNRTPTAAAR